jgi:hypothetical protein
MLLRGLGDILERSILSSAKDANTHENVNQTVDLMDLFTPCTTK